MTENITLTIDGEQASVASGSTLLEAARQTGKDIPTICYHEATTSNALCRICVVEVEGQRLLQPACIVKAAADMKVQTRSERVVRARKTILEMLASTMDLSDAPAILPMLDEYGASATRFPMPSGARRRSKMTTPCTSATTPSACCAGAVCRSAPTTPNTPLPSTSMAAATRPRSAPSSIALFPRLLVSCADNALASARPAPSSLA